MASKRRAERRIKVGVSSCLLGIEARYDGGHKHDRYITDTLGEYFQFVPVCPELEVGMGKIREPVHLEGDLKAPRMIGTRSREDWTDRMNRYSARRLRKKDLANIRGYILKKKSPSCGMERVKVFSAKGMPSTKGTGLFAAALMERFPHLPVEEEGRLNDPRLRESFIVRVFAYDRVRDALEGRFRRGAAVSFHAAHKYLLLAHHPQSYTELGRLVAKVRQMTPAEFREQYTAAFMKALSYHATAKKNVNVLMHIMGFLKKQLSADEKADILKVIDDYHQGLVPLVVPLTLIRHYIDKHQVTYIQGQVYLTPHPKELMLRNHV